MKKYIFPIAALMLLCACGKNEGQSTAALRSAYVSEAEYAGGGVRRSFAGIVEEEATVSIGFKTAGQIKRILVKEGSHVKAGQLLAELDDSDYKLGVEALQIQYDQTKLEVERARKLFEKKSMSPNDYEKAEAGLKQLAVQLQANKNKLEYTRLYAPSAGVIETVNFSKGEMVDAGTAVFSMISAGKMEVVCDIPSAVYQNRTRFDGFECNISSTGTDIEYPLTLQSIVPKADANQLYRMRLCFSGQTPADITAGMNVEVTIRMSGENADVTIPTTALMHRDNKEYVWVVGNDSTVTLTEVVLSPTPDGGKIQVKSGLSAGQKVVRAGVSALSEGEKVKIIGQPSATNVGDLL